MRLGAVRVSRLALVGDPVTAGMAVANIASQLGIMGILGRGKRKRARGGAALVKSGGKVAGGLGVNGGTASSLVSGPAGVTVSLPQLPSAEDLDRTREAITGKRGGVFSPAPSRGISTPRGLVFPTGIAVRGRRRRMNSLNPRALRRAITRVQSFARFARKTITITQRVKLKKRRRR